MSLFYWLGNRSTNPLGHRNTTLYDDAGRSLSNENPLADRTTFSYDTNSQQIAITNAKGDRTTTLYDAAGRTVANIDQNGHRTTSVYDAADQPLALIDANSHRTSYTYDEAGQLLRQTNPLNQITTSAYDQTGRTTLRLDAKGQRTSYTYDAAGQSTGRQYPDGSRMTRTYDEVGKRIKQQDWTGTYTYIYDARNLTTTSIFPDARRLTFAYDALGLRDHMLDTQGGRTTYTYDADNQIKEVHNPHNERTTFGYDASGRRTVKKLANGTRASFTYDDANQVTKVANLKSDNSVISSYDYTYNEIENRTRVEDANSDRTTWTYDKTSQLLSEHKAGASPYHTTFTYDPLGNRITKEVATGTTTYTHDDANQMLTAEDVNGTTTYTYDANGNQATVEQPNNDLTTNTWSYENQMLQTEKPDNTLFTSIYNSDEMRIAKIDTNDIVTSFIWDDQNYITELDDLDTVQVEYTYEPQQYGNLLSQCRDTETSFHHYDALGSTTDLTDETEVVTDEWNYQAFGEENARTGTNPNPYQWVGQVGYYHDEDRDTHQIRARDYQSQVGRFLSRDPIGFTAGDTNLQRYVNNNATYFTDPDGLGQVVVVYRQFYDTTSIKEMNKFADQHENGVKGSRHIGERFDTVGHVYILIRHDNGVRDSTYSFHPNPFPTSTKFVPEGRKSVRGKIYTLKESEIPTKGRVWKNDPVDMNLILKVEGKALLLKYEMVEIKSLRGKEEAFERYLQRWISRKEVGFEEGPRKTDPNDSGNFVGAINSKRPGETKVLYWVTGQNCQWWSVTVLKDFSGFLGVGRDDIISGQEMRRINRWNNGYGSKKRLPFRRAIPGVPTPILKDGSKFIKDDFRTDM